MKYIKLFSLIAAISLVSCVEEIAYDNSSEQQDPETETPVYTDYITLVASSETTKTEVAGTKVKWSEGDKIKIYFEGGSAESLEAVGGTLFTSIFMGITIGPMICELFNALVPANREKNRKDGYKEIWLAPEAKDKLPLFPNPLKVVHKSTVKYVVPCAAVSACTFTFSPVGMTVMLGELVGSKKKELYDKITAAVGVQDAVSNATYLGELIIPMIAFGLPLSPVALGPAAPLFNDINLHDYLSMGDYILYGLIGILGGAVFAYPIAMKKARAWSEMMFRHVSHEALIGAFMGLIFMLAFHEAGLFGILVTPLANKYYAWVKTLHDVENPESVPRDICTLRRMFFETEEGKAFRYD